MNKEYTKSLDKIKSILLFIIVGNNQQLSLKNISAQIRIWVTFKIVAKIFVSDLKNQMSFVQKLQLNFWNGSQAIPM